MCWVIGRMRHSPCSKVGVSLNHGRTVGGRRVNDRLDLYEILQVHQSAQPEIIEAAYRQLALKYHPDRNNTPEAGKTMKLVNRAYEVLSDPAKRSNYDSGHTLSRQGGATARLHASTQVPLVTYTNPVGRWCIDYPQGCGSYELETPSSDFPVGVQKGTVRWRTATIAGTIGRGGPPVRIVVEQSTGEARGMVLEVWANREVNRERRAYSDEPEPLLSFGRVTVSGHPAYEAVFYNNEAYPFGPDAHIWLFTFVDQDGYSVHGSASLEDWDRAEPTLRRCLYSFEAPSQGAS